MHFAFIVAGIIRATLEEIGCYEFVLTSSEVKLLQGLSEVLKPFEEFTKTIQGISYPTINLIPLFITDIENRLECSRMFTTDMLILEAIDILLQNLRKRIELTEIVVAAACLDPAIQHMRIIDTWLEEKGMIRII